MTDYVLKVETVNKDESKDVYLGNDKCFMVKTGSKFIVKLANKGEKKCDVELYFNNEFVHNWRLEPNQMITLRRHYQTKREFVFENHAHIDASMEKDIAEVCAKSTIVARFLPAKTNSWLDPVDDSSLEEDQVFRIPQNHIDWDNVVELVVPVVMCDHRLS